MKSVDRLSQWLVEELSALPTKIRAIYVEFDYPRMPDDTVKIGFDAFGFEETPNDLGDFCWESKRTCGFPLAEFPNEDWLEAIQSAMTSVTVMTLAEKLNLYLACAEHDCEVYVLRNIK